MSHSQRIVRHTAFLSISAAGTKVLLILFAIYATNKLGLAAFGRLEYFLNLVFIFTVLADFGLEQWTTRELARRQEAGQSLIPNLLAFRTPMTLLSIIIMALFLRFVSKYSAVGMTGWIAILYLLTFSFQTLLRGMMRAYGLMGYESILNFAERAITVVVGIGLLWLGFGIEALLGCFLAANVVSLIGAAWLVRGKVRWQSHWLQAAQWSEFLKGSCLFGLAAVFITIFYRQDTILLTELASEEATGSYRSAYRIVEGLWMVPQMLAVALYPVLSELFHRGGRLESICAGAFRFLIGTSLPLAVGGSLVAGKLIVTLYPENAAGGPVFAILVWTMPFVYGNFLVGTILAATDRQRVNLLASIVAVIVNLGLNFYAIPRWGALGAAGAAVITQAVFFIVMFIPVVRGMKDLSLRRSILRSALCCAVMAGVVLAAGKPGFIIQIALGAVVYSFLAWRLRLVTSGDLRRFRGNGSAVSRVD